MTWHFRRAAAQLHRLTGYPVYPASKEKQKTDIHLCSAMVAGPPYRHVNTAFCCTVHVLCVSCNPFHMIQAQSAEPQLRREGFKLQIQYQQKSPCRVQQPASAVLMAMRPTRHGTTFQRHALQCIRGQNRTTGGKLQSVPTCPVLVLLRLPCASVQLTASSSSICRYPSMLQEL
jgi:hypothetical protein